MSNESKHNPYLVALIPVLAAAILGFIVWMYQNAFDAGKLQSHVDYRTEAFGPNRMKVLMNLQLTNNTDETITTTEVRFRLRSEGETVHDAAQTATMTVSEELSVILPNVPPGESSEVRQEFRHVMKAGDDDWSRWTIHPPRRTQWQGVMNVQPILIHSGGELMLDEVNVAVEPWKERGGLILNLPEDPEATIERITIGNGVVEM